MEGRANSQRWEVNSLGFKCKCLGPDDRSSSARQRRWANAAATVDHQEHGRDEPNLFGWIRRDLDDRLPLAAGQQITITREPIYARATGAAVTVAVIALGAVA